jgi:hypothetical protein
VEKIQEQLMKPKKRAKKDLRGKIKEFFLAVLVGGRL